MNTQTFETGAAWLDWLHFVLGTRQWVVAPRLSVKLTEKGYEVAIPMKTYQALNISFQQQGDFGPWHPASGYHTESGRWVWRVTRDPKDGSGHFEQLTGPSGRLVLLADYEAARRRAIKANCETPSSPPGEKANDQ